MNFTRLSKCLRLIIPKREEETLTDYEQARRAFSRKLASMGFGGCDDAKFRQLLNIALDRDTDSVERPTKEEYEQATEAVGHWGKDCRPPRELFRIGLEQAQEVFMTNWQRNHPGELCPIGKMNEMLGLTPEGGSARRQTMKLDKGLTVVGVDSE